MHIFAFLASEWREYTPKCAFESEMTVIREKSAQRSDPNMTALCCEGLYEVHQYKYYELTIRGVSEFSDRFNEEDLRWELSSFLGAEEVGPVMPVIGAIRCHDVCHRPKSWSISPPKSWKALCPSWGRTHKLHIFHVFVSCQSCVFPIWIVLQFRSGSKELSPSLRWKWLRTKRGKHSSVGPALNILKPCPTNGCSWTPWGLGLLFGQIL